MCILLVNSDFCLVDVEALSTSGCRFYLRSRGGDSEAFICSSTSSWDEENPLVPFKLLAAETRQLHRARDRAVVRVKQLVNCRRWLNKMEELFNKVLQVNVRCRDGEDR